MIMPFRKHDGGDMRRFLVAGWFCAFLLGYLQTVWSAEKEAAKPGPATYVGHGGCKGCHAPGSNHVAGGGGKGVGGMITFRKDSGESAKVQNQACLGCHQRGVQTYWEASPHAGRGVTCVNCHTIMEKTSDRYQLAKVGDKTPFFNKRAQNELCGSCHLQRRAQLMRSSHMPLAEG